MVSVSVLNPPTFINSGLKVSTGFGLSGCCCLYVLIADHVER